MLARKYRRGRIATHLRAERAEAELEGRAVEAHQEAKHDA